jgi:hypothetical protein
VKNIKINKAKPIISTIYIKEKTMTLLYTLLIVDHPIWYYNAFFYLFVGLAILTMIVATIMMKKFDKKTSEMKLMQQQHVAKVDIIRKEHSDTLERIRIEMLKREEERGRQWMESEKETLHVLNGVSTLLDLSDKIGRVESEKILKVLADLQDKIGSNNSSVILKKIEELTEKVEKLATTE